MRRVRVLINPHSGKGRPLGTLIRAIDAAWNNPDVDLTFQFSNDVADGRRKAQMAVSDGVDSILVVGGDGMINTVGSVLVGSPVALGVIPTGSGNGFARHFEIPLSPEKAALALVGAERQAIDVGTANERPFFVTCSMAWDAALVKKFEKSPVRGIFPYVFAAAYEFLEYEPQPFHVVLDAQDGVDFVDPLVFTVANLTQFGGGARIAPRACPDDGFLELVVIAKQDAPRAFANIPRLFNGTVDSLPGVMTKRFRQMSVHRERPGPIQMDGELIEAGADVIVNVLPRALTVLIPSEAKQLPVAS